MDTPVIIDVITAAVLLGFLLFGAHRGLFRTAAGLAIVLAALIGAGIAANTLTPAASAALQPLIEKRVEARVDKALEQEEAVRPQEPAIGQERQEEQQEEQQENDGLNLSRLLSLLGIDADPAGAIMEKARDQARDTGVDLVTAVVQALAESVLRTVLFTVFFTVIMIVLKVAARVMDAALKLPGLHAANALGGAAVGLAEGVLAMFLAIWILRRLGVSFDTQTVAQTRLLRFFTEHTPLSMLSFLR